MKHILNIILLTLLFTGSSFLYGQDSSAAKQKSKSELSKKNQNIRHGRKFVDKDGDGYNDNAPDHDGDGIPNGLDQDYIKIKQSKKKGGLPYVDLDGDGINDNLKYGKQKRKGNNFKQKSLIPQSANTGQEAGTGNGEQKRKGKSKK